MNTLRKTISDNKWFLLPYSILLIGILIICLIFNKGDVHIYINRFHSPFFDTFFSCITHAGSGIFVIVVSLMLLFVKMRIGLCTLATYIISGLLVQVLKRLLFYDIVRPSEYLKGVYDLHVVNGVHLHALHSFPSGHSASVFALCACLCFFAENSLLKIVFLICAILVAFSRVYLSQHFLIDISVGSIIGIMISLILFLYLQGKQNGWLETPVYKILKNSRTHA